MCYLCTSHIAIFLTAYHPPSDRSGRRSLGKFGTGVPPCLSKAHLYSWGQVWTSQGVSATSLERGPDPPPRVLAPLAGGVLVELRTAGGIERSATALGSVLVPVFCSLGSLPLPSSSENQSLHLSFSRSGASAIPHTSHPITHTHTTHIRPYYIWHMNMT
jgi:hypothetical protein